MKHLNRFLAASFLIMIIGSVNAQDENKPWSFSAGVNVVDFLTPTGTTLEIGDIPDEATNSKNTLNTSPTILNYATVSRYIGKGFVVGLSGSINEIDTFGTESIPGDERTYLGLDGEISYGFKKLLKSKWIDPYAHIGGGLTKVVDTRVFGTANVGLGIRLWVTENITLGAKSVYKQEFVSRVQREHFQHVASIGYSFGGKDTDGDGISDKNDSCPTVFGLKQANGCPDTDGDGIEDSKDTCPTQPGFAEFNGCSDTDGDGIPDNKDACPNIAGTNALNGCAESNGRSHGNNDRDGDGVKDSEDDCPEIAGPLDNRGCPHEDSDNDGVLDKDDHCPTVAGLSNNNGCPKDKAAVAPSQISQAVINDLNVQFRSVLFDNNKATIRSESYETLTNISNIMKKYTTTTFLIEGHTDDRGSDSYNLKLSGERAASVRNYLTRKGIPSSRIQSKGFGETRPLATNKTEAGRQTNRRVELSIIS